jgi:hypothetical protein
MTNYDFIKYLRVMKASLQSRQKVSIEDIELWEKLTRKIELINILIVEFRGRMQHPNSLKNLLKK